MIVIREATKGQAAEIARLKEFIQLVCGQFGMVLGELDKLFFRN